MSTLYISQKYYDKFLESNALKVIRLYGHSDRDKYFEDMINFLNMEYPFLNIDSLGILSDGETRTYSMYNGYISGDFEDYDEITISFSDPYTKEGNTIISQQVMPMLQKKISDDYNFLYNKRIKKIFMLTSHKVIPFDRAKNSIKEDSRGSTLQLLVKCLKTLGFDVFPFIPIYNLDTTHSFNNVEELVDDIAYIQNQNSGNLQHKQIELQGNKVVGSFAQIPIGQDEKYFAIRFLTAIVLNCHNKYDVSQAYQISGKTKMMKMLYDFAKYVQDNDIICNSDVEMSEEDYLAEIKKEDEFIAKLKELASKYGEDGNTIVTSKIRLPEVQQELRKRLIKKHGCKCLLCDIGNEELLIASHIKDSSVCDIYAKADIENAFLLCANHDKLFDKYLISFNFKDGRIMISNKLTEAEKELCNLYPDFCLPENILTEQRVKYLIWHNNEFKKKNCDM